jgi:hypothetical protein
MSLLAVIAHLLQKWKTFARRIKPVLPKSIDVGDAATEQAIAHIRLLERLVSADALPHLQTFLKALIATAAQYQARIVADSTVTLYDARLFLARFVNDNVIFNEAAALLDDFKGLLAAVSVSAVDVFGSYRYVANTAFEALGEAINDRRIKHVYVPDVIALRYTDGDEVVSLSRVEAATVYHIFGYACSREALALATKATPESLEALFLTCLYGNEEIMREGWYASKVVAMKVRACAWLLHAGGDAVAARRTRCWSARICTTRPVCAGVVDDQGALPGTSRFARGAQRVA